MSDSVNQNVTSSFDSSKAEIEVNYRNQNRIEIFLCEYLKLKYSEVIGPVCGYVIGSQFAEKVSILVQFHCSRI